MPHSSPGHRRSSQALLDPSQSQGITTCAHQTAWLSTRHDPVSKHRDLLLLSFTVPSVLWAGVCTINPYLSLTIFYPHVTLSLCTCLVGVPELVMGVTTSVQQSTLAIIVSRGRSQAAARSMARCEHCRRRRHPPAGVPGWHTGSRGPAAARACTSSPGRPHTLAAWRWPRTPSPPRPRWRYSLVSHL